MLYILYTVYPVSLILSLHSLYTLYPLYTPSILLYTPLYLGTLGLLDLGWHGFWDPSGYGLYWVPPVGGDIPYIA